jgi:ubiquinone/menaquinone biosynthesis C-methylase UbiE
MDIIDKKNLIKNLDIKNGVSIELGCGTIKRLSDSIGIDAINYENVDIVGDIFNILEQFPNSSVNRVHSHHFIAHIDDLSRLMSELERVLKIGAIVEFVAPHFSNPYYYSDPTHKRFLGLYTFCYYMNSSLFSKTVPIYGRKYNFKLESVDLIFKSPRPFYFRYIVRRLFGIVFNLNSYMKEFYEENFVYLISCYEIKYTFKKTEQEKK